MQICPHSKILTCKYKKCPLEHQRFADDLELYFLNIRQSDDRNPQVYVQITDRHGYFLRRAWVYKLFDGGPEFEAVAFYYETGVMLSLACDAIRKAYRLYRLNHRKEFCQNNQEFISICDALDISQSSRLKEAALWFSRQGRAWREHRRRVL